MCFTSEELASTVAETEPEFGQSSCCCTALEYDIELFFVDLSSLVANLCKFSIEGW